MLICLSLFDCCRYASIRRQIVSFRSVVCEYRNTSLSDRNRNEHIIFTFFYLRYLYPTYINRVVYIPDVTASQNSHRTSRFKADRCRLIPFEIGWFSQYISDINPCSFFVHIWLILIEKGVIAIKVWYGYLFSSVHDPWRFSYYQYLQ
jgi:hypothetical protein